jgi:hypothetical protein
MQPPSPPTQRDCRTAIEILTQYERLAQKLNKRLSPQVIAALDRRRDAGTITIAAIPAILRRKWPGGVFDGKTLAEIRALCQQSAPGRR